MRSPAFAGQFYPASEQQLLRALSDAFEGERGPGSMPPRKPDRKAVAAIVPHAGYEFSAPCAAWAYHAIAASARPDLFIIMGPSHAGAKSATSMETWKTPIGLVRPDQEFVKGLVAKGTVKIDEKAMAAEHSIEVQLPLLQFALQEDAERIKICPVMVSHDIDLRRLALDLKETLLEQEKRAILIISSDFTHHGAQYHYVRFDKDRQQGLSEFDGQMIEMIKAHKADEFLEFVDKEAATVCGALPIACGLYLLKNELAKLEQYYTSGDVVGNYRNSVSYAAIVFEEPPEGKKPEKKGKSG